MAMVRSDPEIASAISLRHDGVAQNTAIAARAERVGAVDIEITDGVRGLILRGRGGLNRWRLRVDNVTGALSTEAVV
ncbi:MAG: hypothetical protein DDT22_01329 [candidate division WS2 bacterium]|nr:hypothetical protein [Candidatus Lithacetigena glycinireducens]